VRNEAPFTTCSLASQQELQLCSQSGMLLCQVRLTQPIKAYYHSSKHMNWGLKFLTRPNWENYSSLAKSGFSATSKIVINVVILHQKVKKGNRKRKKRNSDNF